MANNDNRKRNKHERNDNNQQSASKVLGGELRNGRLSQIKNNNPEDNGVPNEYITHIDDESL